jgi:adenylate cyclase
MTFPLLGYCVRMFRRWISRAAAAWPRFGTIRIRTLLALAMGGLVLAASATVLTIALFASATNTFELLNDRTVLILDGIEGEVRAKLDAAKKVVDGLVHAVEAGSLRTASPEQLHSALGVALATVPEVEVLLYWNQYLTRRLVARQSDGTIIQDGPTEEINAEVREALAGAPEEGLQWGEPVVEDGITYMNVAARVDSSTSDARFIVAAVSLEQFSDFVAAIGRRHGATAFVLYGNDRVLSHPSFVNHDGAARGHAVVPIAQSHDPVLINLKNAHPSPYMEAARRQGVEVLRVEAAGSDYIVMYRRIEGYGSTPIAVGAYFPRTEIQDTLRRLAMSAVSGVFVAILGVIAAIMLGGFIARPVHRLAANASAVARLDLDAVEPPPASAIAEVNEQALAFGLMIEALRVFQTYVPRKLVQRLVALGGRQGMPSEIRELTVMFTDIVKFSEISERMGAEETAAFLNRHFRLLAECIEAETGTIDKYIGDAVMAYWGAPDRMDDHAARAVSAARRIAATITSDNARRARKGLKPVRVRIGIHSGPVVVGNIGSPERVNYTIVGDTVNDAQRLESLGHQLDAGADVTILMSAETAMRASAGDGATEDVGAHRLAGSPQKVAVRRLNCRLLE